MYLTGFNHKEIPLVVGEYLGGYAPLRKSDSVHDSLYIDTVIFYEPESNFLVCLIGIDIGAVDTILTQHIRQKVKDEFQIDKIEIFIMASHTHCAPGRTIDTRNPLKAPLQGVFAPYDEAFIQQIETTVLESITAAFKTKEIVEYATIINKLRTIGTNRYDKEINNTISLVVDFKGKEKQGLFINYPCHPTVLNQNITAISADFLSEVYTSLYPKYQSIVFGNGASGDISTRFTRVESSFEEVRRLGNKLVEDIEEFSFSNYQNINKICVKHNTVMLKTKEPRKSAILNKEKNTLLTLPLDALVKAKIDGINAEIVLNETVEKYPKIEITYSILAIDNLILVFLPGEMTSELQKRLNKGWLVCLTNDYLFYFANEDNYVQNLYESQSSFLKKGEAEILVDNINEFINKNFM